ncbi:hypothetical protein C8Q73DRAFT_816861 [Cubamyces lactineus]|nr:hypothetical protein C8Q73DRAFT_816861 [Cubamyces lactineus]
MDEQLEKSVVHTHNAGGNWLGRRSPKTWRGAETKRSFSGVNSAYRDREERQSEDGKSHKDADVVVINANVLVHGLYHILRWCREGREEIVIVPLEALNTLDLLKKGTGVLAQRARAASCILEAQVGTNPHICVQQDDAFVPWDSITFDDQTAGTQNTSPEWVRRTICCSWEAEHAAEELNDQKVVRPCVVLAVLSPSADVHTEPANAAPISASPVPLPAPQPNRYECRLSGALVARWASKAGIEVLEVSSAPPLHHNMNPSTDAATKGGRRSGEGHRSTEEERTKCGQGHGQSYVASSLRAI